MQGKYEGSAVVMTSMQKVEEGAESHGNVMKGLWAEECNGEEQEGSAEGGREEGGKARPFVSRIDKKKRVGGGRCERGRMRVASGGTTGRATKDEVGKF